MAKPGTCPAPAGRVPEVGERRTGSERQGRGPSRTHRMGPSSSMGGTWVPRQPAERLLLPVTESPQHSPGQRMELTVSCDNTLLPSTAPSHHRNNSHPRISIGYLERKEMRPVARWLAALGSHLRSFWFQLWVALSLPAAFLCGHSKPHILAPRWAWTTVSFSPRPNIKRPDQDPDDICPRSCPMGMPGVQLSLRKEDVTQEGMWHHQLASSWKRGTQSTQASARGSQGSDRAGCLLLSTRAGWSLQFHL